MKKTQINVYVPLEAKEMLKEICDDRSQKASEVIWQMIQRSYRAMMVRKRTEVESNIYVED